MHDGNRLTDNGFYVYFGSSTNPYYTISKLTYQSTSTYTSVSLPSDTYTPYYRKMLEKKDPPDIPAGLF